MSIRILLNKIFVLAIGIGVVGCTRQDDSLLHTIIVGGMPSSPRPVAISPDGAMVASGTGATETDQIIKLWRLRDRNLQCTLQEGPLEVYARGIAFDPSGNILATNHGDCIRIWRVSDGKLLKTLEHPNYINIPDFNFSPNGKILVTCYAAGNLVLWNIDDGSVIRTQWPSKKKSFDGFCRATFINEGKELLTATGDGEIQIIRVSDGEIVRTFGGKNFEIYSPVLSRNGSTIASAYSDGSIKIWRVSDGSLVHTINGDSSIIYAFDIDPSGQLLAVGGFYTNWRNPNKYFDILFDSRDYGIKLYRTSNGSLLHTLRGHKWDVTSLYFSQDGALLMSSSFDCSIKIWDMKPFRTDAL
jgi:WD40 repeat protein